MAEKRENIYNKIFTEEKFKLVNEENKMLVKDFMDYCNSTDKSIETIKQYSSTLNLVMCYIHDKCKNKHFTDLTKRDLIALQNFFLNDCGMSSARISFIKSVMNSLSTYIENILDDEFPNFRPIIRKIPNPVKNTVMIKTVMEENEMQNLLDTLVEKGMIQQACFIALLISSGVRKSESLRINPKWFCDENVMYGSLWKTPEEIKTKGRGKSGKPLVKYVLINKFKPYLELWKEERIKLGVDIEDLFVIKSKGKWKKATTGNLDTWTGQIERLIGKRFYAHLNRHFFTTYMLNAGLPADVVKDIVGWASIDMVQTYDDRSKEGKFEKYFSEDGIKQIEEKKISEL